MGERKMIYLDDAINALERKKDKKAKGDIGGFYNKIIQNDIDALMQLPSAQPKRKRGHWIPWDEDDCYECSACGVLWTFPNGSPKENEANFCPKCGAEMRSKEDGE